MWLKKIDEATGGLLWFFPCCLQLHELDASSPAPLGGRTHLERLGVAMVVEDVEIARALLERGAQRNARNKQGETALDVARPEGRGEIAQLLEGRAGAEAAGV